jgi:hypothetical protein
MTAQKSETRDGVRIDSRGAGRSPDFSHHPSRTRLTLHER